MNWEITNDWDSHRPMLLAALTQLPSRVVAEFGCGNGSTPLLDKWCKDNNRLFLSYDSDKEWADKFPCTVYRENLLRQLVVEVDILFVDSKPGEERKDIIEVHKIHADVIIVHDSEEGADYVYGMKDVLNSFTYRKDYKPEGKPHTTAVSNCIDVSKLEI